jgi:hypothetical protein
VRRVSELGGKRIPFLRWSVLRMILGARHLLTNCDEEGRRWRTVEHEAHLEYESLLKDLVLESEYLGR